MKEIGGYIELEKFHMSMMHESAVALNCGRNALWYLCRAKQIKKIVIPKFLCGSVSGICQKAGIEYRIYSIGSNFLPKDVALKPDEWLYLVNYYGQISNKTIELLKKKYGRLIVDNAQAYFQMPVPGVDTIYTCRKYFGVPDGAFLYTDVFLTDELPMDESFERMHFLLGRFERTASEFYDEYVANNHLFAEEPLKRMSKLTDNLLRGIDYDSVRERRTENFRFLHDALCDRNRLNLTVPTGAFMYPLYMENGARIRKKLQTEKIYIPTLWPDVFRICTEKELEYDMAENILPLPVDQRYGVEEMNYIIHQI